VNTITWTALAGADTYTLYKNGAEEETGITGVTTTDTVTPTETDTYTIRGVNAFGDGPDSDGVANKAALVPSQMTKPTIALSSTDITISWSAATANGDDVSRYEVQIYNPSTSEYEENQSVCDGSGATEIANLACTIPMTSFISTLGYSPGDTILAKVLAANVKGEGPVSDPSTETIVAQIPPPTAPTSLVATNVDATTIKLQWVLPSTLA